MNIQEEAIQLIKFTWILKKAFNKVPKQASYVAMGNLENNLLKSAKQPFFKFNLLCLLVKKDDYYSSVEVCDKTYSSVSSKTIW